MFLKTIFRRSHRIENSPGLGFFGGMGFAKENQCVVVPVRFGASWKCSKLRSGVSVAGVGKGTVIPNTAAVFLR